MKGDGLNVSMPMEAYQILWPEEQMMHIMKKTNRYVKAQPLAEQRGWCYNVDLLKMYNYFGLVLLT